MCMFGNYNTLLCVNVHQIIAMPTPPAKREDYITNVIGKPWGRPVSSSGSLWAAEELCAMLTIPKSFKGKKEERREGGGEEEGIKLSLSLILLPNLTDFSKPTILTTRQL